MQLWRVRHALAHVGGDARTATAQAVMRGAEPDPGDRHQGEPGEQRRGHRQAEAGR